MRGRNRMVAAGVVLAGSAMLAGGCVSQQEYDKLWETNRSLSSLNADLKGQLDSCESERRALLSSGGDATGALANLRDENQRLRGQLRDSADALRRLEDQMGSMSIGRLDPQTDLALSRLASSYPDLVIYDADRGMLRFSSDLTFASGSDEVQSGAKNTLRQLASILRSGEASQYDVMIVGHTDAQRIGPVTAKKHPTNMHLSAHRAISVRRELGGQGVPEARMQAAGWGEYRPVVANAANGITPQNRRVEIYLVPSSIDQAAAYTAPTESAPASRTADVDTESGNAPRWDPVK